MHPNIHMGAIAECSPHLASPDSSIVYWVRVRVYVWVGAVLYEAYEVQTMYSTIAPNSVLCNPQIHVIHH